MSQLTPAELQEMHKYQTRLGADAEQFSRSELYNYIVTQNQMMISQLQLELEKVSPTDVQANTDLRIEIVACRKFEDHMNTLINVGRQASEELMRQDFID